MINLITVGLALAVEIFKLINSKNARKFLDQSVKLQLEIAKEEEKGYEAIDSKIESLLTQYNIIMEVARAELEIHKSNK